MKYLEIKAADEKNNTSLLNKAIVLDITSTIFNK